MMYSLRDGSAVPSFQPAKSESLGSMRVLFEPTVFNGTGQEDRVNISLSADSETEQALQAMEAQVRDKLRSTVPNIDALWCSAVKDNHSIKAKIRLRGENTVRCYDPAQEGIPIPARWKGLAIVPIIQVRGVFVLRSAAGLVLEVVAAIIDVQQGTTTDRFM